MNGFQFSDFTFASPAWLLLLLALPILALLRGRSGGAPAILYSSSKLLRSVGNLRQARAGRFFLTTLFALGVACLIIAMARPRFGESVVQSKASGIDIMLVLDVSRSMLAEDFKVGGQRVNRLSAIKKVTKQFIESRPNDRIGIVAFAGQPYLVSPLTLDHQWLTRNLERVKIGLVEDGTAIGSAIASAANRLKEQDSKSRLIVLLTDGDNNAGKIQPLTAAEAAAALEIKIYPIGAGAEGTARIPVAEDPWGRPVYRNIEVKFDEDTLRKIATQTGGEYFRATDTDSLAAIYQKIDTFEKSTIEITRYQNYTDVFHWFAALGGGLLLLELALSQTLWRRAP